VTATAAMATTNNWRQYFLNTHEGFGTTYERFVLHRYFSWLRTRYDINSVLEAPSFGMTGVSGINSLWWARQGAEVTIVDQCPERMEAIQKVWRGTGLVAHLVRQSPASALLPFSDRSFDMSWNFAALWHVKDGETYLGELGRVTKTALFLCVPNQQNICWKLSPHDAGEFYLDNIRTDWIASSLAAHNWRLVETGFFDVPPFPDIAMKKEEFLRRMGFDRLAKWMEVKEGEGTCILDYFTGRSPAMERQVMKFSLLEQSPAWFKKLWAHHRFLLFEKK
jgi:ubiquinone/menaquinone biosynthesis C-methylase UbiE